MKIKTAEATNLQLDWLVTDITGEIAMYDPDDLPEKFIRMHTAGCHNFSAEWSLAGPIIDVIQIDIKSKRPHWPKCSAFIPSWTEGGITENHTQHGPTKLIAAMRCFVASKLGDEVDVPTELTP